MKVYVVTRWIWGGGGDDRTDVIAVCSTREKAGERLGKGEPSDYEEIVEMELDA